MSISHPTRGPRGVLSALDALSPGCGLGLPPRGGRPSLTPAPRPALQRRRDVPVSGGIPLNRAISKTARSCPFLIKTFLFNS